MNWLTLFISLASIVMSTVSIVRTEREIRRLKRRERTEAELAIRQQSVHQMRLWSAAQEQLANRIYMKAMTKMDSKTNIGPN